MSTFGFAKTSVDAPESIMVDAYAHPLGGGGMPSPGRLDGGRGRIGAEAVCVAVRWNVGGMGAPHADATMARAVSKFTGVATRAGLGIRRHTNCDFNSRDAPL